ncbi:MAG TPA: ABC transporter substrate-binding protein [Gaiellaceae bacterium]|jgi:iron complex transport system substrate-binding protein|nr:ABC transporter substrate-binding protein [Gaiellaceae bacterium]
MAAGVAATLALTALAVWAAAARATAHAKPPTRIVSLSATATEDLFAIGAGPQVVAADDQSNYPKQAPTTKLSSYKPNAEAIAKYRPDLVVVSNDGGIVAALHKLGIRVLLAPPAADLNQAYAEIAQLGSITGHAAEAAKVVARTKAQLAKVVASVPHKQLKAFDELSPDLYSATSKTFIGSLFTLFGLTNIADAADKTGSGYPQLSNEYVVAENPDIVVLSDTKCCGQSPKTVAARPGWSNVSAVRHQGVVAVSDDVASRWGPRIVQFAKAIAAGIRRYQ